MRRRDFMHLTTLGALAWAVPGTAPPPEPWLHTLALPDLLTLLGGRRPVQAIGRAYRRAVPGANDPEALAHVLLAACGLNAQTPTHTLHACLKQRIRADFACGRTVRLAGWILAETEARQCALFSILTP